MRTYFGKGWKGMRDWLGVEKLDNFQRSKQFLSFDEARKWVRMLGLKSGSEWRIFAKGRMAGKPLKPDSIPASPYGVYNKRGWISWSDWLGTNNIANGEREYMDFENARATARQLKLADRSAWRRIMSTALKTGDKSLAPIPVCPDQYYKMTGWVSWGDWLGNGRTRRGTLDQSE
jgi:hypothetical protein